MRPRIRILVADDHAVLRSGLRLLINSQPDMEVVAEAADGSEAMTQARQAKPDVTLLDLTMPHTDGIKTISQLVRQRSANRVLVLTMHDDPAYVDSALGAGASGYVVKKAAGLELLSAIRALVAGRIYVDASSAPHATPAGERKRGRATPSRSAAPRLSKREAQVLALLGQGYTNREVAERLQIGEKSAETYRARLSQKLRLHRRSDLVRYALQTGLLSPDRLIPSDEEAPRDPRMVAPRQGKNSNRKPTSRPVR